jgi:hypothetical protein
MGVAADVVEDLLRAGERPLGVDHPVGLPRGARCAAKRAGRRAPRAIRRTGGAARRRPPVEVRKSRRKSRESTRTGRKKPGRQAIQRVPSGERPPRGRRSADGDDGRASVPRCAARRRSRWRRRDAGVGGDRLQGLGGGAEEDAVDDRLVLERDLGDRPGTVKTTWKYSDSRAVPSVARDPGRARVRWHIGQCRLRQLLYQTRRCPQWSHCST